jgi:Cu(I)/Ag(I) efflux system membrane fusion protein/cobalt-zinc-cadmium efflux system membrane fusion protein
MNLTPLGSQSGSGENVITIDPAVVQNIGVRIAAVQRKNLFRSIITNGIVTVDESRTFRVNPKISGWIEKLHVNETGQTVQKGQPLLDIYSPELITAQEEYLLALKGYNALKTHGENYGSNGTQDLMKAARERLTYYDITDQQIEMLETNQRVSRIITIYSPISGVVIHKNAVEGGYSKAGMDLFQIADLSEIWIEADIYEYELPWVEVGQHAAVRPSNLPGKVLEGKISYIYPYLDTKIRSAKVRLAFPNPDLYLKLDMYAEVQIDTRARTNVLAIPRESVVSSGTRNVVFKDLGDGKFLPAEVELGLEADGNQYEILSGISEGEQIVTSAQFLLDSEAKLQEALQKLLASGGSEADIHKAIGHEGHGTSDLKPSAINMSEHEIHEHQETDAPVASGATMDKLFTEDTHYWCPMHHEIITAEENTHCPHCNMFLEEIPKNQLEKLRNSNPYGCVMCPVVHPEAEKDEKCSVCAMFLTPIEEHDHHNM